LNAGTFEVTLTGGKTYLVNMSGGGSVPPPLSVDMGWMQHRFFDTGSAADIFSRHGGRIETLIPGDPFWTASLDGWDIITTNGNEVWKLETTCSKLPAAAPSVDNFAAPFVPYGTPPPFIAGAALLIIRIA